MTNANDPRLKMDDGATYFLYHSIGMFAQKQRLIAEGLAAYAKLWSEPNDAQWPLALEIRRRFIDRWRTLINAEPGTLTTAENVTQALHSLIGSLPGSVLKGRRILVAADCFPSLHFLLAGMAEQRGFTLDTVPLRPGEAWVRDEDFLAGWTDDVAVALLTQCTSTASHCCDVAALVTHGHRMGSLVGIDITQAAGLLPFDVQSTAVDFTVSTSLKWLCGTAGAGILHVRKNLLSECRPELRGWFSQENPFSWDLNGFAFASDARRFDHGTPSILACAGTLPVLEWHALQVPGAYLAHNRYLSRQIIDAADNIGLRLISPREQAHRGGSVMLKLPSSTDPRKLIEGLRRSRVYADCRGMTLRLSPGYLTTEQGVQQLFDHLKQQL